MVNDNVWVTNNCNEQMKWMKQTTCAPLGFKIIKNKRRIADVDGTTTHPAQKKPTINTEIHTLPIRTNNRYELLDTHINDWINGRRKPNHWNYRTDRRGNAATDKHDQKGNPTPYSDPRKSRQSQKVRGFFLIIRQKGFHIKYKETTVINLKDISEWKTDKAQLKDWAFDFHSYTSKEDKTHGFVVAGLEHEPSIEDLQAELKHSYNISTTTIYKMNGTKMPKYLVVMPEIYNLKQLQLNDRYLDHVKITWERHYNNKIITQFHLCGKGRVTSDCLKPAETPAMW